VTYALLALTSPAHERIEKAELDRQSIPDLFKLSRTTLYGAMAVA
jgi:hypothetical protein